MRSGNETSVSEGKMGGTKGVREKRRGWRSCYPASSFSSENEKS